MNLATHYSTQFGKKIKLPKFETQEPKISDFIPGHTEATAKQDSFKIIPTREDWAYVRETATAEDYMSLVVGFGSMVGIAGMGIYEGVKWVGRQINK